MTLPCTNPIIALQPDGKVVLCCDCVPVPPPAFETCAEANCFGGLVGSGMTVTLTGTGWKKAVDYTNLPLSVTFPEIDVSGQSATAIIDVASADGIRATDFSQVDWNSYFGDVAVVAYHSGPDRWQTLRVKIQQWWVTCCDADDGNFTEATLASGSGCTFGLLNAPSWITSGLHTDPIPQPIGPGNEAWWDGTSQWTSVGAFIETTAPGIPLTDCAGPFVFSDHTVTI